MRNRLWRVDRIDQANWDDIVFEDRPNVEYTATPLDGRDTTPTRFFLPLENVETGAMPNPDPEASTSDPEKQQLILDAYRLSLIHGSAPLLGLQRSRAVPTEFQLVPLLKILGKDRARMLIADDVGTGKTIEAGLVMAELFARGLIRKVLIVVPASLREQWREALDHFFHFNPTIVAGHLLPALERQLLPGQSVWESHNIIIASIDYLKSRTNSVLEHDWDLIIFDEAHLVAKPHTSGPNDPRMQRWQFARQAAKRTRHLLLLTATPHNGYFDTWASLFYLLDPNLITERQRALFEKDEFGGKRDTSILTRDDALIDIEAAKRQVVQRRRKDIEKWYRNNPDISSPFPRREQREFIVNPSDALRHMLKTVSDYAYRLRDADKDGRQARFLNSWIAAHLHKRALSSPEAIRKSLLRRKRILRDRAITRSKEEDTNSLGERVSEIRSDVGDVPEGDEAYLEENSAPDDTSSHLDTDSEAELIQVALEAAEKVTPSKDAKLQKLFELLAHPQSGRLYQHGDKQRVIVFTRFKDTLDYISSALKKEAKKKEKGKVPKQLKVFEIYGEMSMVDRVKAFKDFERCQDPAVLVATDCISEGLNLQIHCAEVIHYEIPWNPNRLEQRNGRIDRYGQPEEMVGIHLLVVDDDLDQTLLHHIVMKARQMFEDQGFVSSFITNLDILLFLTKHAGNRVVRQGQLIEDDLPDDYGFDTDEEIVQDLQPFYVQDDVSFGDVAQALEETRAAVGGPETLKRFLDMALRSQDTQQQVDPNDDRIWTIPKPKDQLIDILKGKEDQLFSFDPELGLENPDVDVVDLSHPLIHRLVDIVRRDSQAKDFSGRVAGYATPGVTKVVAVIQVLARFVAEVEKQTVLMEELFQVRMPVFEEDDFQQVPEEWVLEIPSEFVETNKTTADIKEFCEQLFDRKDDFYRRIDRAVEDHRQELSERHGKIGGSWAHDLDKVETASSDVLAITIHFPPSS